MEKLSSKKQKKCTSENFDFTSVLVLLFPEALVLLQGAEDKVKDKDNYASSGMEGPCICGFEEEKKTKKRLLAGLFYAFPHTPILY